ncbi:MAG: aminopeptidase [Deltaproteobacteria bacterium]|nr:aminopeptidase [Deltaproteobacteria bacterium]
MGILTIRRLAARLLVLFPLLLSTGCSTAAYLVQAGIGQLSLYNHERPLQEVIDDPHTTEKVRERLKWVPEIKKMVETELGVPPTSNYTTYVQVDRPYLTWALTAAEPFELKTVMWSFPFFGAFPYLGFFKEKTAQDWAHDYQLKGYDTYVRGASAYSTLGWLRDPMVSTMLYRDKGAMVDLIFHESTHGQIYLKGQVDFNEQIASYVGDTAEKLWIERAFGKKSKERQDWDNDRTDRRLFGTMLKKFAEELKAYYASSSNASADDRRSGKESRFAAFQKQLETAPWAGRGWGRMARLVTNNAALLAFLTYEDEQALFDELDEKCGGHLKDALRYLKSFEREWDRLSSVERGKTKPQVLLKERLRSNARGGVCLYLDTQ